MKKLVSVLLLAALLLSLFTATASAADSNPLSEYSDKELRQLYDAVREEMIARGLPLAQEVTLREGKFIVGEDLLPDLLAVSLEQRPDLWVSDVDAVSIFIRPGENTVVGLCSSQLS